MTSMTRGPLSPAVYWRRRLFVLGLAAAMVVMLAGVLGGGSDGSGDDPDGLAEQVAGTPLSSPSDDSTRKTGKKKKNKATAAPTPTSTPLPAPTGACTEGDILVEPVVEQAVAGRDVLIVLELRTRVAEACTWQVSSMHVTLKVTSGSDDIWASRQCPRSVPVKDVVVRQDYTTKVGVIWNGRRSDQGCTRMTGWALPGYYHVAAAPLGGEPAEVQFRLAAPTPEVITETPKPNQNKNKNKNKNKNQNPGREN
jgi:hypothetical protein